MQRCCAEPAFALISLQTSESYLATLKYCEVASITSFQRM